MTAYGICGVKIFIFKGEIMEHDPMARDRRLEQGEANRQQQRPAAGK
jgi:small subunit ribosomal protein S3